MSSFNFSSQIGTNATNEDVKQLLRCSSEELTKLKQAIKILGAKPIFGGRALLSLSLARDDPDETHRARFWAIIENTEPVFTEMLTGARWVDRSGRPGNWDDAILRVKRRLVYDIRQRQKRRLSSEATSMNSAERNAEHGKADSPILESADRVTAIKRNCTSSQRFATNDDDSADEDDETPIIVDWRKKKAKSVAKRACSEGYKQFASSGSKPDLLQLATRDRDIASRVDVPTNIHGAPNSAQSEASPFTNSKNGQFGRVSTQPNVTVNEDAANLGSMEGMAQQLQQALNKEVSKRVHDLERALGDRFAKAMATEKARLAAEKSQIDRARAQVEEKEGELEQIIEGKVHARLEEEKIKWTQEARQYLMGVLGQN